MAEYFTDMKDLLFNMESTLKAYQNTDLDFINTWKVGVLPSIPAFPALVLLPQSEIVLKRLSNQKRYVERSVLVELYLLDFDTSRLYENLVEKSETVFNILQDKFYILNEDKERTCYSFELTNIDFSDRGPWGNKMLQKARFIFKGRSWETITRTRTVDMIYCTPRELLDHVYDQLDADKADLQIGKVHKGVIEPTGKFPLVSVSVERRADEKDTGQDFQRPDLNFLLYSYLTPRTNSLTQLLKITDLTLDWLATHSFWGGRAVDTYLNRVDYDVYTTKKQFLYTSLISSMVEQRQEVAYDV